MDVIKPDLFWVQDRCYRRNPSRNNYDLTQSMPMESDAAGSNCPVPNRPYEEFDDCAIEASDEEEDSSKYVLQKIESGSGFKSYCDNIPSSLFPVVIGNKGSTKNRIQQETNTKIIVPRINEKGDIIVRGQRRDVINARRRLDLLVSQARFKRDITHFVCLSMNTESVIENFKVFRDLVLKEFGSQDLSEEIFQPPEKLHITICVAVLLDGRERDNMIEAFRKLNDDIKKLVGNKTHSVQLKGLEIMNDDPSAVDVLYAKCILKDDIIQNLVDFISNELVNTGYVKPSRSEKVKLHVTLMNTRYRAETVSSSSNNSGNKSGSWRSGGNARISFDARQIMEKYKDYEFGTVNINEIFVVTRHTTSSKDGFYNCLVSLKL